MASKFLADNSKYGQTSGPPKPGSYSGGKVTTRDTSGSGSTGGPAQHPSLDPKLARPTKTQG